MSVYWTSNLLNSSFIDAISEFVNNLSTYVASSVILLSENRSEGVLTVLETLPEYFHCDDFQWKLLKVFSSILLATLFLIFIAWNIFGKQICERFMKPATSKAIEDLKASVAKLKLPKEHTPRV